MGISEERLTGLDLNLLEFRRVREDLIETQKIPRSLATVQVKRMFILWEILHGQLENSCITEVLEQKHTKLVPIPDKLTISILQSFTPNMVSTSTQLTGQK